jgi:hypothetical protein
MRSTDASRSTAFESRTAQSGVGRAIAFMHVDRIHRESMTSQRERVVDQFSRQFDLQLRRDGGEVRFTFRVVVLSAQVPLG